MSRLRKTLAGAAQPVQTSAPAPMRRVLAGGRRGEEVVLPVLGRVWIELPGARAWQEMEAAVRREMRRLEVGELGIETAAQYEAERALRVLAMSVRDADHHDVAFGSLEDWGELADNDVIIPAWHAFEDVRERLDPVTTELSAEDAIAIGVAVKKNDPSLLRAFGVVKLSAWLASMGSLLLSAATPSSPSSASPSES